MSKELEHIYSLGYQINNDGSIDLEQDCGCEIHSVSLHSSQVRHLFENAGLMLPSIQTNELVTRLAQLLVEIRHVLSTEIKRSSEIHHLHTRVEAFIEANPGNIFNFDNKSSNTSGRHYDE